jgi:GT2 family glycosyltransferase
MSKIGISILHHKDAKLTSNCLLSLQQQTLKDFTVYLLIQGASREDEITLNNLFGKWDKIIINLEPENKGFAEGNNINIRQALKDENIDFILTLNNDTTLDKNFLTNILNQAKIHSTDMVQGTMMKMTEPNEIDCLGIELMMSGLTFNIKSDNKILFCPSAGAALYSRQLLEITREEKQISTGFESRIIYDYFDSSFFAYAEDFDLGFRARLAGFNAILAENAICYHLGSATTSVMSDFAVYHTYRNLIFALYKNLPKKLWWEYGLFILIGQIIIKLNSLKRKQLKTYVAAFYYAFKNLNKFKNKRHLIQNRINTDIKPFITKKIIDPDYLPTKPLS